MSWIEKGSDGCVKQSMKCWVYTGKTLKCIDVKAGDNAETVICKINSAFENVYAEFSLNNFEYADLIPEGHCPPKTFKDLINLILYTIQNTNSGSVVVGNGDLTVAIAPCDVASFDGAETTDVLAYVQFLAQKLCSTNQEITNLQDALTQANLRMDDLQNQINALTGA
jgi:hypothetical protein